VDGAQEVPKLYAIHVSSGVALGGFSGLFTERAVAIPYDTGVLGGLSGRMMSPENWIVVAAAILRALKWIMDGSRWNSHISTTFKSNTEQKDTDSGCAYCRTGHQISHPA